MSRAHIVDGKVKTKGWKEIICIDSHLVFISDERFVNAVKTLFYHVMDVLINLGGFTFECNKGTEELMWALIDRQNLFTSQRKVDPFC